MNHTIHDVGVAKQIGAYSDAIEAAPNARWLMTSGTPGLALDGKLPGTSPVRRSSPGRISSRC